MAARDHVVGAVDDDERRAGQLGEPVGDRASGWQWSSVPWTRSIGQRTARQVASTAARSIVKAASPVGDHRVDRPVERPADGVLDLLGRVRLGRDLLEEEPGEVRRSRVASSGGCTLAQPSSAGQLVLERPLRPGTDAVATAAAHRSRTRRSPGRAPDARRRTGSPRHTPSPHSPTRTARAVPVASMTASRSPTSRRRRTQPASVGRSERPLPRPSKATTRWRPAEVGDLALPLARMDDRRRRQEHDRRVAGAEDFVGDADAVAGSSAMPVTAGGSTARISRVLPPVTPGRTPATKSRIRRLTRTGSRAFGMWPPPSISSRRAPGIAAGEADPAWLTSVIAVVGALDDERRDSGSRHTSLSDLVRRRGRGTAVAWSTSVSGRSRAPSRRRPRSAWSSAAR